MAINSASVNDNYGTANGQIQFADSSGKVLAYINIKKVTDSTCATIPPALVLQESDGNLVIYGRRCVQCPSSSANLPSGVACPGKPATTTTPVIYNTGGYCGNNGIVQLCTNAALFSTGPYSARYKA